MSLHQVRTDPPAFSMLLVTIVLSVHGSETVGRREVIPAGWLEARRVQPGEGATGRPPLCEWAGVSAGSPQVVVLSFATVHPSVWLLN